MKKPVRKIPVSIFPVEKTGQENSGQHFSGRKNRSGIWYRPWLWQWGREPDFFSGLLTATFYIIVGLLVGRYSNESMVVLIVYFFAGAATGYILDTIRRTILKHIGEQ